MKSLIAACLLLLLTQPVSASNSCSPLQQQISVYFGNGINTSFKSADRSAQILRSELGDSFNNIRLEYKVAYNRTNGIALDLVQSLLQAELQWSSQVMGWMNNLGLAPDWFNAWFQQAAQEGNTVVAPELDEHVLMYHEEIVVGHGVLVVSHSQGNFYVNAAKSQLREISTDVQMASFGIFGVATPANNVGGEGQPYYTNHRDFISRILPDTLPDNWRLRYLSGQMADDINPIAAHLFNDTYMSARFNMKNALVGGFKARMGTLRLPQPACTDYRPDLLGQLIGEYYGQYFGYGEFGSLNIDAQGVFNFPKQARSFIDRSVSFGILHTFNEDVSNGRYAVQFQGDRIPSSGRWRFEANWYASGQFANFTADLEHYQKTDKVPYSSLKGAVDLVGWAGRMMKGYRGVFPPGTCSAIGALPGPGPLSRNERPLRISVDGTTVTIGDQAFNLQNDLRSESIDIVSPRELSPPNDLEPQFALAANLADGTLIWLTYKQFKGMVQFSVLHPSRTGTSCFADWYGPDEAI